MADSIQTPPALPHDIAAAVHGFRWDRDTLGESGASVYRLRGDTRRPDLFLKHGAGAIADDVTDEMVRLRWLGDHLPVPRVVHLTRAPDAAWLLMTAMPGQSAYDVLADNAAEQGAVVDALARFMRRLHALPPQSCPFNSDLAYRLGQARARIDAGLVDIEDFDEERAGWSAEQVWSEIHALLPLASDPVVTHCDFSLDNLLIDTGEVVGCIDVGRAGLADRYQDLAILWNCLGEFGAPLQERLLRIYGITEPDRDRLFGHLLLDELF